MSFNNSRVVFLLLVVLCLNSPPRVAQEKAAVPPKPEAAEGEDALSISVEEVRIPVAAFDAGGRFDAALAADDLLVREDGVAQQVRGVYRLPADVLVVVDTGGESNPSKQVRLTREAARRLVSALRAEDRVALMQVNNRVELLHGWTAERAAALKALRDRLLSARRSVLAEGLVTALEHLRRRPAGNRHLVIISDGLDSGGGRVGLEEALKRLAGSDVAVHVISYTALGRAAPRPKVTRKRERGPLPDEGVMALPRTKRGENSAPDLRQINEAKGGVVVDLERLFRGDKGLRKKLEQREDEFEEVTEETGGLLCLPSTADELLGQAELVAREVDSRYVVTYKPRRPFADAPPGQYRKLDVISRRLGLTLRSRRGYVVKGARDAGP